MISTVLVTHPWLSPTALVVLVVAGWLAGPWLADRPRLAAVLGALSLVPLALLTLVPVDRELFARCSVGWALPTPGRVELMANVVLFVPPVYLAAVALRRPALALLAGSAASAAIEAVQALAPAIGRSCDTNDWLSNTIGAAAGALLAAAALRRRRRRAQARPTGTNPDS
ncbi:MAG TPA: VanZ family protein [Isoptericola sp.]|nr:VanZ family protein [Isoptericola sp.]